MSLAEKISRRVSAIEAGCREQLPIAAEAYADTLRVVLGKPGTRDNPSQPGEAPHKVTGELWESIQVEPYPDRGIVLVGPTAMYAPILAKTRPFYEIAADQCRQKMRDIVFDEDAMAATPVATSTPGSSSRRIGLGGRIASFFRRRK